MKRWALIVSLLALGLPSALRAGDIAQVYDPVSARARDQVATADSSTLDSGYNGVVSAIHNDKNRPSATLHCTASVSTQTCTLWFIRGYFDPNGTNFHPKSVQTITLVHTTGNPTIGGRYTYESVCVDTAGWPGFMVGVEAIANGNVTIDVTVH